MPGKSGSGSDHLAGGAGNDRLFGGRGNDKLEGGAGNNFLDGGGGENVFVFGLGNDRIADFDAKPRGSQDKIDLTAFGLTAETFEDQVSFERDGCNTVVSVEGGGLIVLLDFERPHLLTQSDFIL